MSISLLHERKSQTECNAVCMMSVMHCFVQRRLIQNVFLITFSLLLLTEFPFMGLYINVTCHVVFNKLLHRHLMMFK